jgi:hypothetical protein
VISELLAELRKCAGWDDLGGARAAAAQLAKLDPARAAALVAVLEQVETIDLSEDDGDVSDEIWRTRNAADRVANAARLTR